MRTGIVTNNIERFRLNSMIDDTQLTVGHGGRFRNYAPLQAYLGYLQQDLVNIMEKMIPQCLVEGQYMHPGPKHIDFAMNDAKEVGEWTSLNTDAHLRSVFFGRSETIVLVDGALDLGEFGYIYFVDWDQIRDRDRVIQVQIIGE